MATSPADASLGQYVIRLPIKLLLVWQALSKVAEEHNDVVSAFVIYRQPPQSAAPDVACLNRVHLRPSVIRLKNFTPEKHWLEEAGSAGILPPIAGKLFGVTCGCNLLSLVVKATDEFSALRIPLLGDDGDRVAELGRHGQAAAGQLQLPFDGLVAVGHAAHGQLLRFPFGRGDLLAEQLGRVFLHHDLRLEIQAGRETEVLMKRAGVTVRRATAPRTNQLRDPDALKLQHASNWRNPPSLS